MTQAEKSKFRQTSTWKKFRKKIAAKKENIDPITLKKLYAGYNCHHLDDREAHYTSLDEEKFICVNKTTHKMLHWLYTYWKQDRTILDRLEYYLNIMYTYSS